MTNKKLTLPSLLLLLVSSLSTLFFNTNKDVEEVNATNDSYWSSWISSNQSAINSGGTILLKALQTKITENHEVPSYDHLRYDYEISDAVPGSNGAYIWDMYGGNKYAYTTSLAGGANTNGTGYNREHSVPKSWFGEAKPAYSDLVHVIPADAAVNGTRSNYAYGEVSSASKSYSFPAQSHNGQQYANAGVSKLGTSKSINGVSCSEGTVFEPDDQYKGDFARIYMYFATRYGGTECAATKADGASIFSSTFTNTNPYMTNYGLALMQKWHVQDPVSQKEIDRNNAIESQQGNRNPFVDYPEWADKIFHTKYAETHNGGGSGGDVGGGDDSTPTVNSVTLSSNSLTLDLNGNKTATLTVNVNVSNGATNTVTWKSSNTSVATVSNGVITALKVGTSTITATSIYDSTKSATCTVTVKDTTSSGGTTTEEGKDATMTAGTNASSATVNGANAIKCGSSKATGDMTITVPAGTIKLSFYAASWKGTNISLTVKNGSSTVSNLTLKSDDGISNNSPFTLEGSESDFYHEIELSNITKNTTFTLSSTARFVVWGAKYHIEKAEGKVILQSITLNTDNVTKTFDVGDTFTYSGLVVTAHYSDSTSKTVTPTSVSTPDMSSAGTKTVNVTYVQEGVSATATYQITVNEKVIVTYTASVSKTFMVGETITKNDIVVKASTGFTITDFTFEDYEFKYEDAKSGGALTNKTLTLTVQGNSVSFTAQVQREAHKAISATQSVTDTLTASDLKATSTSYTDFSGVTKNSGAVYAGQSALNNKTNIQLRSTNPSGIVSTTSGGKVAKVVVQWASDTTSGRTLDIYGSNNPYSSGADLYSASTDGDKLGSIVCGTSTELLITGDYTYIGLRSNKNAMYFASISISYNGSSESDSAVNLANYIMFEDTTDQCLTKYRIAEGYFKNLSSSEQKTFITSEDYVISTAKARLDKWAEAHGEKIELVNDGYQFAKKTLGIYEITSKDYSTLIIILFSSILAVVTSTVVIKKRKKI